MDATASEEMRDLHQAAVFIEHLVQADNAAQTMQSFCTYLKGSEDLFKECTRHTMLKAGTQENWGSLEHFAISLAAGQRDCRIFGGASTGKEYLQMAIKNQRLWASNGQNVSGGMVEGFSQKIVARQEDTIMFS
jgi:hypothetical protein